MEYYGNEREGGVNGHFYHVFYTVRGMSTRCVSALRISFLQNAGTAIILQHS